MAGGFSQAGVSFVGAAGAFVPGAAPGFHKPARDFLAGVLPFNPTIDLNFAGGSYFGVSGSPSTFLTTVRAAPAAWAVDASGNWTSFGANTPRITNLGLLVEESRTNVVLSFANGWATNQVSTTPAQASPDGGTNATLITDNSINSNHYYFSNAFPPATGTTVYTASAFFKAGTIQFAGLSFATASFASGFYACVNLQTGAITQQGIYGTGTVAAASAQVYPNGWVRLQVTGTVGSTAGAYTILSTLQNSTQTPTTNYIGTGSTLYGWMAQTETGAFATSPIPTTASAVTRAADVVTLTTLPGPFGPGLTVFAQGTPSAPISYGNNQWICAVTNGATHVDTLYRASTNGLPIAGFAGSSVSGVTAWNPNTLGKLAASTTTTAQNAAFNGVSTTGAIANTINPTVITFGSFNSGVATTFWDGLIARVALWPTTALTGAQLQQITT